jgi:hypothetical protein
VTAYQNPRRGFTSRKLALCPPRATVRQLSMAGGSILVGYYDNGDLVYAGKVGTGFGSREGGQLIRRLRKHERKQSPFREVSRADAREARWAEPVTVAEVEFTDWTRDRRVRHPSLKGIREDKDAREVTIERAADGYLVVGRFLLGPPPSLGIGGAHRRAERGG